MIVQGLAAPFILAPAYQTGPDWLDPCDMAGCQGRVAHHYWAMMTNITATHIKHKFAKVGSIKCCKIRQ